jgi:NAD(P)-dependent dehydrogenase (short-subunit alcohol dehydrogenase family)
MGVTPRSVMERFRLDDRVALVTGASSGLGVHFALALADAGADLVLGARRADRLQETAQKVRDRGRRALCVELDVSSPEKCTMVVESTIEEYGRLDVLVNNAGVGTAVPALRETPEQFRDVLDVNLFGAYWMSQAVARVMPPGGSIINISSVLGITTAGLPQAAYAASKAGLIGLTRDLAQQWGKRRGIRVNAIAPGYFASEMTEQYTPEYREKVRNRTVLGEFGDADDLAASLVWLASDAARYVIGEVIVIDGGFTIG